jgi:hypothetical protein
MVGWVKITRVIQLHALANGETILNHPTKGVGKDRPNGFEENSREYQITDKYVEDNSLVFWAKTRYIYKPGYLPKAKISLKDLLYSGKWWKKEEIIASKLPEKKKKKNKKNLGHILLALFPDIE